MIISIYTRIFQFIINILAISTFLTLQILSLLQSEVICLLFSFHRNIFETFMPVLASGKLYAVFSNSSNQMNLVVIILEIKSIFLVEVEVAFTFQLFPCFLLFLICILALHHDLFFKDEHIPRTFHFLFPCRHTR